MIKLKTLKENEPYPDDFWNYNVNHITGYAIKFNLNEQTKKTVRKYAKPPTGIADSEARQVGQLTSFAYKTLIEISDPHLGHE